MLDHLGTSVVEHPLISVQYLVRLECTQHLLQTLHVERGLAHNTVCACRKWHCGDPRRSEHFLRRPPPSWRAVLRCGHTQSAFQQCPPELCIQHVEHGLAVLILACVDRERDSWQCTGSHLSPQLGCGSECACLEPGLSIAGKARILVGCRLTGIKPSPGHGYCPRSPRAGGQAGCSVLGGESSFLQSPPWRWDPFLSSLGRQPVASSLLSMSQDTEVRRRMVAGGLQSAQASVPTKEELSSTEEEQEAHCPTPWKPFLVNVCMATVLATGAYFCYRVCFH